MSDFSKIVENAFYNDFEPKAFIDLNQLRSNLINIKKRERKCQISAVVKSDAYGHGICKIADEINDLCDSFSVASFSEAFALRIAGIQKNILCLLPVSDIYSAIRINMQISVISHEDFERIYLKCKNLPEKPQIHFVINTGMNRFGYDDINVLKKDCVKAIQCGMKIVGIFSHFYNSSDYITTKSQYEKFLLYVDVVKEKAPKAIAHISASGGFEYGEFDLDMVRIGMLLYGYKPENSTFDVKPIMRVIGHISQKRLIKSGENLLYGDYPLKSASEISLINYGYFDGLEDFNDELNKNCMNISAVKSFGKTLGKIDDFSKKTDFFCKQSSVEKCSDRLFDITDYLLKNGKLSFNNIYQTLINLGRIKNKVYYYGN